MMILPIIFLALALGFIWLLYNGLVTLKARINEAWSGIDVQLKRRADLIPNLVEAVKGYAAHEKNVFENVTKARSALMSASGPKQTAIANDQLSGALKTLFAIAESYPDLKTSQNFLELQQQLGNTEDKIAYARQFYNSNVLDYNVKIRVFPNVMLANVLGFKEIEFFKATEGEEEEIKVTF